MRFIISILFFISVCSCTSSKYLNSKWNIDSNTPATYFDENNSLSLDVSNDDKNLYITIESQNSNTISKIEELGMTVWLSNSKNPNKEHAIHYPLPFKNTTNKVALEGFNKADLVAFPMNDIKPIRIQSIIENANFSYTLSIPFSELHFFNSEYFTISISSFTQGKQEYLSEMSTSEEIEVRLDEYKANPNNEFNKAELAPFYKTFRIAKKPDKSL